MEESLAPSSNPVDIPPHPQKRSNRVSSATSLPQHILKSNGIFWFISGRALMELGVDGRWPSVGISRVETKRDLSKCYRTSS